MDDKAWQLLMTELKDIKSDIRDVKKDIVAIRKEFSMLKIKLAPIMIVFVYATTYLKTKFFS